MNTHDLLKICERCDGRGYSEHRAVICTINGRGVAENAAANACPRNLFNAKAVAVTTAPVVPWGPRLWAVMHAAEGSPEFLGRFAAMLPPSCGCRRGWADVLAALPPRYGSEWFAWTVEAHNAINRLLGKREMTVDEARAKWLAIAAGSTAR